VTRWLVTGASGQLGTHLVQLLMAAGADVIAPAEADLDITDAEVVHATLANHRPDVVVNGAAYTAVDAAEEHEDVAYSVNATGPRILAESVAEHPNTRLIHVSTDYVFAGTGTEPYEVDSPVGPAGAYGRTKLAGERAVLGALPGRAHVVRTAWVYGGPSPNFVDTMVRLAGERETVNVVDDQIGSPTYVRDLAGGLIELAGAGPAGGVLHYVNAGQASWYELAREVFRLIGADPDRVRPVDTASFPRPAPRPPWSVLSTRAWVEAGLTAPRPWTDALADALRDRRPA
jgi:dTDP-4-dehydrorhamnose reductase